MGLRTVWQNQLYPMLFFAVECFETNTCLFLSILGLTLLFDGSAIAVPMLLEYVSRFDVFFDTKEIIVELGLVALVIIHCIATISVGALWSMLSTRIETDLVLQTYRARTRGMISTDPPQEKLNDAVLYSYFSTATTGLKAFLDGYIHFFFRIILVGFFGIKYANTTQVVILWILCLSVVGIIQHFIYITTFDYANVIAKRQHLQSVALNLLRITALVRERRQEKIEEVALKTVLDDYVATNAATRRRYLVEHVWYFIIFFTGLIGGWAWFRTHQIVKVTDEDLVWCALFIWVWLDGYLKLVTHTAEDLLQSLPVMQVVVTTTLKTKQSLLPIGVYENRGAGRILLENVFYGKEGGDELKDITLEVSKATVVGIVSTGIEAELLLQLILRKGIPTRGKITIDCDDPAVELAGDNVRIAYLGINPLLMNRSITANLSYGLITPPTAAALADVVQTLELSSLITRLPKGLNTILTADVLHRLTDGEKQLLAVGRILLSPSPIVVLDHALDRVSLGLKLKVIQYICKKPRTHTTLIITARLAALHPVDTVFVFHKGCLVEADTPTALLALGGHYHKLYFAQAKLSLITQTKR